MPELRARTPEGRIFRIGRLPDAWEEPDWSRAGDDKTFGHRFDDPKGEYRVLYGATQRVACFLECLACFRPDLGLLAELVGVSGSDDFSAFNAHDWARPRALGSAGAVGRFADVYSSGWISLLRKKLAAAALRLGISEIDQSTLQSPQPRRLTQLASRIIFTRGLNGVYYSSRFGSELENWALFEPWTLDDPQSSPIVTDDADLNEAMRRMGIRGAMA